MNDSKVLHKINAYVKMCGTQKEAAARLGISAQYLNDILSKRRKVSEVIADKFGYTAEWVEYGRDG